LRPWAPCSASGFTASLLYSACIPHTKVVGVVVVGKVFVGKVFVRGKVVVVGKVFVCGKVVVVGKVFFRVCRACRASSLPCFVHCR